MNQSNARRNVEDTVGAASGGVKRRRWRKPPSILQQSQMDCGAACMSMICQYYGKRISVNDMRDRVRVGKAGASMANISAAATEIGFEPTMMKSTWDHLVEQELPAIGNWKGYHWIVLYEVTPKYVLVGEPAKGLIKIPKAEFTANWSGYLILLDPTERFSELPESPPQYQRILPYIYKYKMDIFRVFLAAMLLQIMAIFLPLTTSFIIDEIIMKENQAWLNIVFIGLIALLGIRTLLRWIWNEMVLRLGRALSLEIIRDVHAHMLGLTMRFFQDRVSGDITSRFKEHETITRFISNSGIQMISNLLALFLYGAVMIWLNPALTVAAFSLICFNILLVRFISPRIRQLFREYFVQGAETQSHLIESIKGLETIKTIGADTTATWTLGDLFARQANTQLRVQQYARWAQVLTNLINALSTITLLFWGATFVLDGAMSIGAMLAFNLLAYNLYRLIVALVTGWDELQEVFNAIERLGDITQKQLELSPFDPKGELIRLPKVRGAIRFEKITFRYQPDDLENVMQNFSLSIPAGQKVAFVGQSGCGKSTVIKLLYQFYRPNSGTIVVDGFKVEDLWLPSLREHLGLVIQKPLIFNGTIRDNIAIARPGATLEQVQEAARMALADEFIERIPGGYDAMLEEAGSNLSGGQQQRLALARAFLLRPSILILDEATSALDNTTESKVMANIEKAFAGCTILMIAHRLSTIRNCDQIVCLNKGMISEQGTHDELMNKRGIYFHLNEQSLAQS